MQLIIFSLILAFVYFLFSCLINTSYSNNSYNPPKERRNSLIKSETFDKIDAMLDDMGEHTPNKFIIGSHYWNKIPHWMKYEWVKDKENNRGLIPKERKVIEYRNVSIHFDNNDRYRFDIE